MGPDVPLDIVLKLMRRISSRIARRASAPECWTPNRSSTLANWRRRGSGSAPTRLSRPPMPETVAPAAERVSLGVWVQEVGAAVWGPSWA